MNVTREKLVREPRTVQGRAMLTFWLDGRTHPPSTARRDEFVGHIIAIENAVLLPMADAGLDDWAVERAAIPEWLLRHEAAPGHHYSLDDCRAALGSGADRLAWLGRAADIALVGDSGSHMAVLYEVVRMPFVGDQLAIFETEAEAAAFIDASVGVEGLVVRRRAMRVGNV